MKVDRSVMRLVASALSTFASLVALTVLLGPAGSVPFALTHGMSPLEAALVIGTINAAMVPMLFVLFEAIDYSRRYHDRVVSKILDFALKKSKGFRNEASKRVMEFEQRVGQFGFGLALMGFSFLFGNVWASAGAYFLNLKKATMIISIAIGALTSSIFWTLAFIGTISFLPSPWILYAILTGATFSLLVYKKIGERKLYRKLFKKILPSIEEKLKELKIEND